jgi:hypothetical protein
MAELASTRQRAPVDWSEQGMPAELNELLDRLTDGVLAGE